MSHLELIAMDPGVKGVFVPPACDHQDLVRVVRAQNLHRDKSWKILYESLTVGEPLYDLIDHPLFDRQTVDDSDHMEPPASLILARGGSERPLFTRLHLYAAPLGIVAGVPARGNEKVLAAAWLGHAAWDLASL
jgi:hypothetical protein